MKLGKKKSFTRGRTTEAKVQSQKAPVGKVSVPQKRKDRKS